MGFKFGRRTHPGKPPAQPSLLDVEGVCPICETTTRFVAEGPWLRDQLVCVSCLSVPRERALIATLNMYYPNWRELAVHESSPALRASAKLQRECRNYTPSFFYPDQPRGVELEGGARNENLEHQTFAEGAFDLVITQDVFEHLFRPDHAIAEIARTLKPGGAHVSTFPIGRRAAPSERRAILAADGQIQHLLDPIYHGNPIDSSGSLVTIDYGYDVAAYFDHHSDLSTTIVFMDDLSRGIRAEFIEVMVSRKPTGPWTLDV